MTREYRLKDLARRLREAAGVLSARGWRRSDSDDGTLRTDGLAFECYVRDGGGRVLVPVGRPDGRFAWYVDNWSMETATAHGDTTAADVLAEAGGSGRG